MALPLGLGMVLADIGEVMDNNKKNDFNIDIMKDEFLAFKNMTTICNGLAMLMRVVVIYTKIKKLRKTG